MLSVSNESLTQCIAVTFAPDERMTGLLAAMAERLGFGARYNFHQINELPADRLAFILIHGAVPDETKLRILRGLRSSENDLRRYAPTVCMVANGPRHQIVQLIQLGFDEVLFMTDGLEAMRAKLLEQLAQEQIYVETARYFGPDRRRIERIDPRDSRRSLGPDTCRKISVSRHPQLGILARDIA